MKRYEIEDLINSNRDIKKAYEVFREKYRRYEIFDIYAVNHFEKPIIEVYIYYYDCNYNKRKFEYYEKSEL